MQCNKDHKDDYYKTDKNFNQSVFIHTYSGNLQKRHWRDRNILSHLFSTLFYINIDISSYIIDDAITNQFDFFLNYNFVVKYTVFTIFIIINKRTDKLLYVIND